MAGRLPGVGVPPRKRSSSSSSSSSSLLEHNHYHLATYRRVSPSVSALDETALKARQRLQKKLAQFFPSSRENENPAREGKGKKEKRDAGIIIGKKLLSNAWLMSAKKKERKVCAVCLEDFQQEQEQQVMNLSCSHKFHSACLLPWLQSHPHCPYCRNPVDAPPIHYHS